MSKESKILVTKITIWNFFHWFLPSHKGSIVLKICFQCSAHGWEATQGVSTSGLCVSVCACSVAKSCLTLCDPKDCNLPGSSVRGIFQARMLEWVAISYPGDCPDPGIEPEFPVLAGRFFTTVPPGKPHFLCCCLLNKHITDPLRPVIHTLCSMTNTCLPSPVPGGTLNSNHSAFQ